MRRNDKGFLLKWRRKMLWSFLLLLVAFSGSAYANDYEYAIKEDGTARIVEYSGESDVAVIPSQIDGYKVTEIGETVFLVAPTDRRVRQITLPATVQILSFGAFIGTNLTRMELPE
ncbi:MAG: hypothetical protein IJD60_10645, partial [Clostridia bacterium]|nr:hypothetical protein [Clostridia bacterium]